MLGNLYILTAPSGAGKTTLAEQLIASTENIQRSVSYTTRPPRPGEKNGVDYWFVDQETFENMAIKNDFLEFAKVHDYLYATSLEQTQKYLNSGIDLILTIDWQGAQQVRRVLKDAQHIKNKAISIFILPPSKKILRQRLQSRNQDNADVIENRLAAAAGEISHCTEFDYLIMNDALEKALQDLQAIVRANRLCETKQSLKYKELLAEWLEAQ